MIKYQNPELTTESKKKMQHSPIMSPNNAVFAALQSKEILLISFQIWLHGA